MLLLLAILGGWFGLSVLAGWLASSWFRAMQRKTREEESRDRGVLDAVRLVPPPGDQLRRTAGNGGGDQHARRRTPADRRPHLSVLLRRAPQVRRQPHQ